MELTCAKLVLYRPLGGSQELVLRVNSALFLRYFSRYPRVKQRHLPDAAGAQGKINAARPQIKEVASVLVHGEAQFPPATNVPRKQPLDFRRSVWISLIFRLPTGAESSGVL
jgi:hypothetical protein